jgi:hypothetical protein
MRLPRTGFPSSSQEPANRVNQTCVEGHIDHNRADNEPFAAVNFCWEQQHRNEKPGKQDRASDLLEMDMVAQNRPIAKEHQQDSPSQRQ